MKSNRKVSLVLAALVGVAVSLPAAAADGAQGESCREETRRVAVWPKSNPKLAQVARFENREVKVCDGVSQAQRDASEQKKSNAKEGA